MSINSAHFRLIVGLMSVLPIAGCGASSRTESVAVASAKASHDSKILTSPAVIGRGRTLGLTDFQPSSTDIEAALEVLEGYAPSPGNADAQPVVFAAQYAGLKETQDVIVAMTYAPSRSDQGRKRLYERATGQTLAPSEVKQALYLVIVLPGKTELYSGIVRSDAIPDFQLK